MELTKTKTQEDDLKSQIDNIQSEISAENNIVPSDSSEEKIQLQQRIDVLNNEINNIKFEEQNLRSRNNVLQEELKKKAEGDDGKDGKIQEEMNKLKEEKEKIDEELKLAQNKIDKKNEDFNVLDTEYNKLQNKQQKELDEREERLQELQNKEKELINMLKETQNEFNDLKRKNETSMNDYKAKIKKLESQLNGRNNELSQLQKKGELSEDIQLELVKLKQNAVEQEQLIAKVKHDLANKESQIANNQEELLKYQMEKKNYESKITELEKEINKNKGNEELTKEHKQKLEVLQNKHKELENQHNEKLTNLELSYKTQLEEKQRNFQLLIDSNNHKTAEQEAIIVKLQRDLQEKGIDKSKIDELNRQLDEAEKKKVTSAEKIKGLNLKISELNDRIKKTSLSVSVQGSNVSLSPLSPSSISYPSSPSSSSPSYVSSGTKPSLSEILELPYVGIKVSFPKDRIKLEDNIIAPISGRPLALAIIAARPHCWFWKPFDVNDKENIKIMKYIEEISKKKTTKTIDDYVYLKSINGKIVAPSIDSRGNEGIKFSTRDSEEPQKKFMKLAKGETGKSLEIVFIYNKKEYKVFVKRLRTAMEMPNCLDNKYGGNSKKRGEGKRGGGKKERMDFDTLENIKREQYSSILQETDELKKKLSNEMSNEVINNNFKKLDEYNEKFNKIYEKYVNIKLSYENWKVVSKVDLEDREEFNDNIKELKDLLYEEINKNPKKDYIQISLLENKEILDKLLLLGDKKIYIKCKRQNDNENLQVITNDDSKDSQNQVVTGGDDEEYNCIPVKLIEEDDCKEIKKRINDILELLNTIRETLGIKPSDDSKSIINDDNDDPNKTITGLMSQIRTENLDPSGTESGNAEILTKSTMIIYNIILGLIVLICIFTIILHIFNIIKFLYETFLEIGKVQHNNLETGETLRYKLLHYITYINNCNLPSIFSSFNSKKTTSETIIKLSTIVNDFFKNSEEAKIAGVTEYKDMLNDMDLGSGNNENKETECEIAWKEWLKTNPNKGQSSEKERICKEVRDKNQINSNNSQKEPLFNIFMIMRLLFMTIKLYLAFFMIVIIVFIIYVLLTKVAALTNMTTLKMNPFAKQISFMTLLKASGICFIYIIISFICYKFMFVKLYNKYLETYLHIIAIDFELNKIKKDNDNPDKLDNIDTIYAELLHDKIDNFEEIEEKIMQYIEDPDFDENTIVKYILYYVLIKHIYDGKNKEKLCHLKVYSYFINSEKEAKISNSILVDINTTYYSLIPDKYRKVPLQYFKFNNIKKLSKNIEKGERIRKQVNSKLSILNDYISSINKEFDDDNYIVNLGWYFLINLIISTIFIGILIVIFVKGWMEANNNFYNFVKMDN